MRIDPDPESGTVQVEREGPRGCSGGGDDSPRCCRPLGATVTNKVGDLAEGEGHHSKLTTEWGSVVVTWWSHKINGLHRNGFVMAAMTNDLQRALR
jgi:hypothetical protein